MYERLAKLAIKIRLSRGTVKILNSFTITIISIVVFLGLIIAIAVCDILELHVRLQFVSIMIAIFAALYAARAARSASDSVKIANESANIAQTSLELVRSTTRPFVNMSSLKITPYDTKETKLNIYMVFRNSGNLPADHLAFIVERINANEECLPKVVYEKEELAAIIFPNEELGHPFDIKRNILFSAAISNARLSLTVKYKNEKAGKEYHTTRSFEIENRNIGGKFPNKPIPKLSSWS